MQGNVLHVEQRFEERLTKLNPEDVQIVLNCAKSLDVLAKKKKLPNEQWYRTVTRKGKPVAHLVGQGVYLSSVLEGDMVPHGRNV